MEEAEQQAGDDDDSNPKRQCVTAADQARRPILCETTRPRPSGDQQLQRRHAPSWAGRRWAKPWQRAHSRHESAKRRSRRASPGRADALHGLARTVRQGERRQDRTPMPMKKTKIGGEGPGRESPGRRGICCIYCNMPRQADPTLPDPEADALWRKDGDQAVTIRDWRAAPGRRRPASTPTSPTGSCACAAGARPRRWRNRCSVPTPARAAGLR